jgi:hypothetical protein
MLMVALVLAVIGLVALVVAVVTNNEMVAWVCIAASSLGVIVLIADAIRERMGEHTGEQPSGLVQESGPDDSAVPFVADADDIDVPGTDVIDVVDVTEVVDVTDSIAIEDHPEELVHDEPEYDMPGDDEPEYEESAEEAAIHIVDEVPEPEQRSSSDEV